MEKSKIAAFIVIYNEKIDSSLAYKTLSGQKCDLFFFDNSTNNDIAKINEVFAKTHSLNYFCFNDNIGLAKAYNFLLQHCNGYDFIMTSDDDTIYPPNYIDYFQKNNSEYSVFFPKVFNITSNKAWINAPYRSKYLMPLSRIKHAKKSGYYYFINSGTIYSAKVLEKFKFNGDLFVEQVDTAMSIQLKKNKIKQKELDITIKQNFAPASEMFLPNGRIYDTYNDYFLVLGPFAFIVLTANILQFTIINKDFKYLFALKHIFKNKLKLKSSNNEKYMVSKATKEEQWPK